ncbi:hypothetical protein BASA81_001333 [Batrachochytrium salamandrivorans]|nr:hypothetical protein BASA81_001333 [Batrachochytrium salamandrivorans]
MRIPQVPAPSLQYVRDVVAKEPLALAQIRHRIAAYKDFEIQIGPEEGRLLQLLIRLGGYRTIVEIGTHAGYSTMFMAQALPQTARIYTLEKDPKRIQMARETFASCPHECEVTLMEGDALESLKTCPPNVDMVFIDADKLNYSKYLDWCEIHVRVGGLIVGDNTFLHVSCCPRARDGQWE